MKNVFDVILMIWISLIFLFCMVIFSEEVLIKQQSIHIRNKVNEIIEINGGYTQNAKNEINDLISKLKYQTNIEISKEGKLAFGEKVEYKIIMHYTRKLPFLKNPQHIKYETVGEYYNASY